MRCESPDVTFIIYINLSQVSSFREALRLDVNWDLLSVQLIVYPIMRGGGGGKVIRRSED